MLALVHGGLAASIFSANPQHILQHWTRESVAMRHCSFQLFATFSTGPDSDFVFTFDPAPACADAAAGAVILKSQNFPKKFVSPLPASAKLEPGRLGINDGSAGATAFTQVQGLGSTATDAVSLVTATGEYLCLGPHSALSGSCHANYQGEAAAGDVLLGDGSDKAGCTWRLASEPWTAPPTPAPPPAPAAAKVDATARTHAVSKHYLGCHSDSGYTHQARGFYSQMVFDGSFEDTSAIASQSAWSDKIPATATATIAPDPDAPLNGLASRKIAYTAGTGAVGLANRGLGNEGLAIDPHATYEGYFFAKGDGPASFVVSLETTAGEALATPQTVRFGGGNWTQLRFSLTTGAEGTRCVGIAPGSDPTIDCGGMGPGAGHVCVSCGGQFKLALTAPATVNVDFVFLNAPKEKLYKGLNVLAPTVETLLEMGVSLIRQGGSFASGPDNGAYYQWEKWRGAPWERPSAGATWNHAVNGGWGPFEFIDMCNAAGIEPVVTTTCSSTPQSFANLVEYCWGNGSTPFGALRSVTDGHPAPYEARIFELGNEQYNANYVEQVAAMEEKAVQLGMGGELKYMFPNNGKFLNDADLAKAKALSPRLDAQMLSDEHVGGGGGVEEARGIFDKFGDFKLGAVNAETNAGIHTVKRAMMEAVDLMDWFNAADIADRLVFRTASFCTERSGHYDAFDQGISFFLPNMTWIQPPGYVHAMIAKAWQPNGVNATSYDAKLKLSAQVSDDGRTAAVSLANDDAQPKLLTLTVAGVHPSAVAQATTLFAANGDVETANPPSDPTRVSPQPLAVTFTDGAVRATLPGHSFTSIVLTA